MTDLDKLIAAVSEGTLIGENLMVSRDLSEAMDNVAGESWGDVCSAYEGSLDAAKALHDALLPEWRVEVFNIDGEVVLRRNRPIDRAYGAAIKDSNPARAWLIAILKAYRSTQEASQ